LSSTNRRRAWINNSQQLFLGKRACGRKPSGVIPSEARNLLSVKEKKRIPRAKIAIGRTNRKLSASGRAEEILHKTARLKS
jgi:hypothetical protein